MKWIVTCLLFISTIVAKGDIFSEPYVTKTDAQAYVQTLKKLTDVMVGDVTGPCAAARYYAYANMAAYEVIYQQARPAQYVSFAGLLKDYPGFSTVKPSQPINVELASLYAVVRAGEELLPSGFTLENARHQLVKEAGGNLSPAIIEASCAYADSIVKGIVKYAARDGYVKTSGYMRYTPFKEAGSWQPTPPGYMEAYEPHWGSLRPFLLDSATQFPPAAPVAYNQQKNSGFYKLAKEVQEVTSKLSQEQIHIANFWDCNPFFLNQKGHISFATKKISPGGHWMGITGIACTQKQLSLAETIRWHALVGITMSDAFISCWKEKFRSNRIRPETFINTHVDPDWRPLLQTPPFPEYTSGHSVVSSAVSTLLTTLAGENFAYTDITEVEFGVPARSFTSFKQAAQEAAISRLYGGIHYRDAIDNGLVQGKQIGNYVVQRLKLKQ
ncbi:vanadium-dependent haloperoxidase [Rhodocytophaga aerolata]|uniref:Vanadium-dependent haloperoxidase n=1 Tax=Rhodocytophaga aerolata TaxID=455078 RepID=A0ABT8QZ09_9BACT|nr:vanadium-dependent haloperoxidase [Rhodocytophaga aerolata]MDO1445080.1 vanadium-dependent haloperoxidase [Rhodocytophaga aerolata]